MSTKEQLDYIRNNLFEIMLAEVDYKSIICEMLIAKECPLYARREPMDALALDSDFEYFKSLSELVSKFSLESQAIIKSRISRFNLHYTFPSYRPIL